MIRVPAETSSINQNLPQTVSNASVSPRPLTKASCKDAFRGQVRGTRSVLVGLSKPDRGRPKWQEDETSIHVPAAKLVTAKAAARDR